jgi:[ribosomal protein S5]-alanine N-acetyltransferase
VIAPVTPRLTATPLAADDLDILYTMHRDPVVMATLGGVRTDERTREYLAENLAHWSRNGFGLWMFRDRATGAFVGRGGIRQIVLEHGPEIEVAYALMPHTWGKGLATEIAAACIGLAFGPLGLRDLVAFTLPDNHASRRVMEKTGFRYEREFTHHDLPHVLYRTTGRDRAVLLASSLR